MPAYLSSKKFHLFEVLLVAGEDRRVEGVFNGIGGVELSAFEPDTFLFYEVDMRGDCCDASYGEVLADAEDFIGDLKTN